MLTLFRWLFTPLSQVLMLDRLLASRQAALLWALTIAIERKLPLVSFLEAFAGEARGPWRIQIRSLADILHAGVSIPEALEAIPGLLPPDAVMMVRIAHQTGRLGPTLRELAGQYSRRSEIARTTSGGTLVYIATICMSMLFVGGFIMYWIIPKFKAIFAGFDMELPPMTVLVVNAADIFVNYWYFFFLVGLGLGAFVLAAVVEMQGVVSLGSGQRLFLPQLFPRLKAPIILRGLSIAVDAGRPLGDALTVLAETYPDLPLRRRIARIEEEVSLGRDCWDCLRTTGFVRRRETAVLDAATRAGNLGWALRSVAEGIERRIEFRAQMFLEVARPLVLLVMGVFVGTFVVGLFVPVVHIITQLPVE